MPTNSAYSNTYNKFQQPKIKYIYRYKPIYIPCFNPFSYPGVSKQFFKNH